jgi:hypothetical protein
MDKNIFENFVINIKVLENTFIATELVSDSQEIIMQ